MKFARIVLQVNGVRFFDMTYYVQDGDCIPSVSLAYMQQRPPESVSSIQTFSIDAHPMCSIM